MGLLEQLVEELGARKGVGYRHTSPSGTPSTPYYSGAGGLWSSVYGVEQNIISTILQPKGIAGAIPARGTMKDNPLYGYLTSFTSADTGGDPDGVCDDPPSAGEMRNCFQTAVFGRYSRSSREVDIDRVGRITDRGEELLDLRLLNGPLRDNPGNITTPSSMGTGFNLQNEIFMRHMEIGIYFQEKLMKQLWVGNPANNSAGGGYKEFPGLDLLIATGKKDALTNTACPSLDSDIKNFNYLKVGDLTPSGDIVNVLTYMMRYLRHIADRTQLSPVQWVLAMRPLLFYELVNVWACSYMTYRCTTMRNADTNSLVVDNGEVRAMRDAMINGQYLLVEGVQIPVILDDAIYEDTATTTSLVSNGCFASDIYVLPMSVRGGIASLYWEHIDYRNPSGALAAAQAAGSGSFYWSDDGRYLWHAQAPKNFCVKWIGKIEPRLILLTPHLAGRITNIQYCPLQHERDVFADDPYYVAGGVASRGSGPSLYASW